MNFLMSFADFFAKGGPLMWPILLCSVLALAIVLFKTLEYTTALHTLGKIKQGDSIPLPWFLAPICERTGDSRRRNLIPHSEQAGQEAGAGARRPGVDHDDRTHPGAYRHSDRHDQHISSDRGTRITGGSFRARRGYMGSPDHDGCRITGRPSRACRLSFP